MAPRPVPRPDSRPAPDPRPAPADARPARAPAQITVLSGTTASFGTMTMPSRT